MSEELFQKEKDEYSPSVGYAQLDISKHPELALEGMEPENMPVQIIIGAGQMRNLEVFIKGDDGDKDEMARVFTNNVRQLTGSHLVQLTCQ